MLTFDWPKITLYFIMVSIGLIMIVVLLVFIKKNQKWPYQAVPIMSPVEKKFYWQLVQAFPHYTIFAQVQLSRVIRPPKNKHELKWLNKIWRMSLDYVILNEHLQTLVVIELDDRSHLSQKRQEADARKNKALKAAGIRLIRIKTNNMPTKIQLINLLENS